MLIWVLSIEISFTSAWVSERVMTRMTSNKKSWKLLWVLLIKQNRKITKDRRNCRLIRLQMRVLRLDKWIESANWVWSRLLSWRLFRNIQFRFLKKHKNSLKNIKIIKMLSRRILRLSRPAPSMSKLNKTHNTTKTKSHHSVTAIYLWQQNLHSIQCLSLILYSHQPKLKLRKRYSLHSRRKPSL